jgi:hypothetical protein
MNSDCPSTTKILYPEDERRAPASRFLDEKVSDDSGAETNSALAPAGLKNPFWK